jgi:hypothetical protein
MSRHRPDRGLSAAVLKLARQLRPCDRGELRAGTLAREPVAKGDVGACIAVRIHESLVQRVVTEFVGVGGHQRVHVQN